MTRLHWAASMADDEKTLCNEEVWQVLERGDDITSEDIAEFVLEPAACPDCIESANAS